MSQALHANVMCCEVVRPQPTPLPDRRLYVVTTDLNRILELDPDAKNHQSPARRRCRSSVGNRRNHANAGARRMRALQASRQEVQSLQAGKEGFGKVQPLRCEEGEGQVQSLRGQKSLRGEEPLRSQEVDGRSTLRLRTQNNRSEPALGCLTTAGLSGSAPSPQRMSMGAVTPSFIRAKRPKGPSWVWRKLWSTLPAELE